MHTRIKQEIKAHALKDAPKEACGFIYITEKSIHTFPCTNISPEPTEAFEIEHDDYFNCCRLGTIVAVYHSQRESAFSPADILHADEWPLPLHLYSIGHDTFKMYLPKTYVIDYLGRPFIWGHYDCYNLVRDYYRREFKIYLGDYDADESFENNKRQDIILNFMKEGFVQSSDVSNIKEGDVLLFEIHGNFHVGIYLTGNRFLHHPLRAQSRIEPIDGFWAKGFKFVLRHKTRI